jgi:hypothetical protein
MGGGVAPARVIVDPLDAIGFVLHGDELGSPVVFVAIDWCEIRNDAYDRWRTVLAEAAGSEPERVMVTALHQHDAPLVDLQAQRILERHRCAGAICDLEFHEVAVQRVARAVRTARLQPPRPVTHIGLGRARVERVASNRRYTLQDGSISFGRTSACHDLQGREAPEGLIDPWLRTLSLWEGPEPLIALSHYAVHPMSYYGQGGVSADFVGMARRARQRALPNVVSIYASGCSGNVTAGKYNDGSPENRPRLAARLEQAMATAWEETRRVPLTKTEYRVVPLHFDPRQDEGFRSEELSQRLTTDPKPFNQCLAALGLSWRQRLEAGRQVDLPALDFGQAVVTLLPGESYVEYQLLAQALRPDALVLAVGYGESATGYIPTARHWEEGDGNLRDWCWVAPSAERVLTEGLKRLLPS